MAIVTADDYMEWRGETFTGDELVALERVCVMTDRAVKSRLRRTLEYATFTKYFPATKTPDILLTRWAPIDLSEGNEPAVYLDRNANGDPDAFGSDDLLTRYQDYDIVSPGNEESNGNFGPCILRKASSWWGVDFYRPPYSVATKRVEVPGAVKVVFKGGYQTIPEDLLQGVLYAISMILHSKKFGFFVGSESWNGYSYNLPGVGLLVNGILGNPDVATWINPYVDYSSAIG